MLDAWAGRVNFPELKQKAREFYEQHRPDSLIIESKATGPPLIQELRKAGLYVEEMGAHRGQDKVTKTHSVADMFSSGAIWAPLSRRWAQEVVEEMAAFPYGEFDDLHDAAVLGLLRLWRGGFRIATDKEEEEWNLAAEVLGERSRVRSFQVFHPGCLPRHQAGNITEVSLDLVCLGERLMMTRLSSPARCARKPRP